MFENLNLKVYTKEAAESLAKALSKLSLKEVKGDGTFEVIATTEGIDRDGEVIKVDGWDFANYMKNPIMLWGHNYYDMSAIIGAVTEVIPGKGQVIVRGTFANTESGQMARQLYDDGILKAVSVGFIPKEREGTTTITKAELLEISFVSVPSNPDALSLSKVFKLDNLIKTSIKSEEGEDKEEGEEGAEDAPADGLEHAAEPEQAAEDAEAEEKGVKSGRVLSQKNRTLVQTCIDGLQALLDASEPEKAIVVDESDAMVKEAQAMVKVLERVITRAKKVRDNS